jgi:tRNA(adenine34) deaminase
MESNAEATPPRMPRAARVVGGWRLEGVTVYATLEPCPMCAGAMVQARIARCAYAAHDPKKGADGSVYDVLRNPSNNHRIEVSAGICEDDSAALLRDFFRARRGASS